MDGGRDPFSRAERDPDGCGARPLSHAGPRPGGVLAQWRERKRWTSAPARTIWGHVALVAVTVAVIWGGVWLHLSSVYRAAEDNARAATANMAQVMEENVLRSIAALDQALLLIRDSYQRDPDGFSLRDWATHGAFQNELNLQIAIANGKGDIVQSNLPVLNQVNIADRAHFRVHRFAGPDRIYISRPVRGRVSNRLSIQFTRRIGGINGGDGDDFGGVVIASLDPLTLSRFYRSMDIGHGFIALLGTGGVILAGRLPEDAIGQTATSGSPLGKDDGTMAGVFQTETRDMMGEPAVVA